MERFFSALVRGLGLGIGFQLARLLLGTRWGLIILGILIYLFVFHPSPS